jgi:hypothetical protein
MAARAAELLLMQLRGESDEKEHVLESSLTFRQSTGPAANRPRVIADRARRAKLSASATS